MSTALVAQWVYEHVWLAPLPPVIWFVVRTRTARTVVTIARAEVRDRYLRAKGVPVGKRRELIVDVVERDAKSS